MLSQRPKSIIIDHHYGTVWFFGALLIVCLLAGCSTKVTRYSGVESSKEMTANTGENKNHIPFRYAERNDRLKGYDAVLLDPVTIYTGNDHQFGKMSEKDKATLSAYMDQEFRKQLKDHIALSDKPGSHTLRLHLTLAGATESVPVISTVTKITPYGFIISGVVTAMDQKALFDGHVIYVVELYDSTSGELIYACITKQYPWAIDVFSSFGMLDASKAGIRAGASDLAKQLHQKTPAGDPKN